jgi:flagellar motor switch/type III secretory pathway protein FliN
VDAQFAGRIVDRTLGGEGAPLDVLRTLSSTEHAVMEFLCLVLCREINGELGAPLVKLAGLTAKQPEWLAGDEQGQTQMRRLIATFMVDVNDNNGSVRLHFSPIALSELRKGLSYEGSNRTRGSGAPLISRKIRRYAALAPDVSTSLVVGHTEVAASDLADLECGDVVVIQQVSGQWVDGRLSGMLPLRVGDGDKAVITARVTEADPEISRDDKTTTKQGARIFAPITVTIESVHAESAATLEERTIMEENSQADGSGEGAALLDGLLLTVRVELAGRRMRMDELAQLRAGQILELGCRATDPVDLVVDGRSIARGELVDIEGRLGVRIAQVPA